MISLAAGVTEQGAWKQLIAKLCQGECGGGDVCGTEDRRAHLYIDPANDSCSDVRCMISALNLLKSPSIRFAQLHYLVRSNVEVCCKVWNLAN
jgi:hypothetical protein